MIDFPLDNSSLEKSNSEKTNQEDVYENDPEESYGTAESNSDEMNTMFEDEMISKKSPIDRILSFPASLESEFKIAGNFPVRIFNVSHLNFDDVEETVTIDARIEAGGMIVAKNEVGNTVHLLNVLPHDLTKIRNFLITEHTRIDGIVEKYNLKHSNRIPVKYYTTLSKNDRETMVKYKNQPISVPNAILDQTSEILNQHLPANLAKEKIEQLKRKYLSEKQKAETDRSFFTVDSHGHDNLNQSKLLVNRTMKPKVSSTPLRRTPSSRPTNRPKKLNFTIDSTQRTIDSFDFPKEKKRNGKKYKLNGPTS